MLIYPKDLRSDEVILDRDLLRQVITWAMSVGTTNGMPSGEEFEDILDVRLSYWSHLAMLILFDIANFDPTPVVPAEAMNLRNIDWVMNDPICMLFDVFSRTSLVRVCKGVRSDLSMRAIADHLHSTVWTVTVFALPCRIAVFVIMFCLRSYHVLLYMHGDSARSFSSDSSMLHTLFWHHHIRFSVSFCYV